jgi:predicted polyphosphate/ATP-dependent NAD kinase
LHRKKLGLIINPVAGIGGRVGLKGSDGLEIQKRARRLGAVSAVCDRTIQALERLRPVAEHLDILTYPAEMGENAARACGFALQTIGEIEPGATTAQDTRTAAREALKLGARLLLFAGGDGTARDICRAVNVKLPVLGIPAGVKIHSAVFATNPANAGSLAAIYLQGRIPALREAEVMDIDEEAYRRGQISARLYGYLKTPVKTGLVQNPKVAARPAESSAMAAIAREVVDRMEPDTLYILGPGTSTRAVTRLLGLAKTLIGVDVVLNRRLLAADVNEAQLIEFIRDKPARIIITPVGGQGYLFGRGNQQISPAVIEKLGKNNIIVIGTTEKIQALRGAPFLVDTGSRRVDEMLAGYLRVITGCGERIIYRIAN